MFYAQPGRSGVVLRNFMNDGNCFSIFSNAYEEARTFDEGEQKEAKAPQQQRNPSECEQKVAPPHILGTFTDRSVHRA